MALGKRLINTGGVAACSTDSTDPFGDSSGVALYSLDYDASTAPDGTDYSGTPTNVEFGVGGQINYGARFNGSSSYVSLPSNFNLANNSFTISAWFANTKTSANSYGITSSGSGSSCYTNLHIGRRHNNGKFTFAFFCADLDSSTNMSTDGTWQHWVCTYDATTNSRKIYLNGTLDASDTASNDYIGTANLQLGGDTYWGTGNEYQGKLDQVRIFSKALSSDEVDTLYAETACVYECTTDDVNYPFSDGTNVEAYYKLDNSAEDETGSYDGTESNIEYRFGRFGQAAVFNGSNSDITINNFATLSQVGLSFWVNMPDVTSQAGLITKYGSAREFSVYIFGGDLIANLYYNGNNGNAIIIDSTTYMSNNTWHHIAYTADGSNPPILWIDGEQVGTPQSSTNNSYNNTSEPINLGAFAGNSAYYYDGKIDQVRIYSTALTSSQVTQLYEEKPCEDTSNFKTVLYEGNGGTQYISNVGFQPDLVWIKSRDKGTTPYTGSHYLFDSIRGALQRIKSNDTDAENTFSNSLTSFDTNGFSLGSGSNVNYNGDDFVAWVWKGGGDAVNIGVNTITASTPSIASDVSANTAGFSIVSYTGNGTAGSTVAHGLDNPPELIIAKNRDESQAWIVNADVIGKSNILTFSSGAKLSRPNQYYYDWDSDTITLASDIHINGLNDKIIAYCFHSVTGYSKIGTYEGLGTSTVTVSGLGFKPSWIIVKNADDTANWNIYDSRRSGNDSGWDVMDTMNDILYPNLNIQEIEGGTTHVFTANSDGFVVGASNHLQNNKAGDTYIYMAFK